MKLLSLMALVLGLTAAVSLGQEPDQSAKEREALCKSVPCRAATTVTLKLNERQNAEFKFARGPFVADGFISILNGEHFGVEFNENDGRPVEPHYVAEIAHADRTVSFELSQLESGTQLKIANPFSKAIVYDCLIQHGSHPDPDNRRAIVTAKPEVEGAGRSGVSGEVVIIVKTVTPFPGTCNSRRRSTSRLMIRSLQLREINL